MALLAALAAMNYPALVNGYPLLYSDSGTYIVAGFLHYVPVDRPYFYPYFVRHTSMGFTLWFSLIAQSLLLFYTARMALKYVLNIAHPFFYACLLMVGLSFTTGLAHNNSQIIADVFSPTALLCFGVIASAKYLPKGHIFFLLLIFLFSLSVHNSHLLIFSILAVGLWLTRLIFKKRSFFKERRQAHRKLIFWSIASWLVVSVFNFLLGEGLKPSKAGNVFLVARTIETGAAKVYLDKHCPDAPKDLCAVKDNLPPHAVAFLWEYENSPMYDSVCMSTGGWGNCWTSKNREYGNLVKNIVAYTPSRNILVAHCIEDSWQQLLQFDLGYLIPMAEGSPVFQPIKDFLSADWAMYKNAVQYQHTVSFKSESSIQRWVVYLSLLVILVFLFLNYRTKQYSTTTFAVIVVLGSVVNGVVCASFSGVVDRYMARMIWLIPFAAILLVGQWVLLQKKKKTEY